MVTIGGCTTTSTELRGKLWIVTGTIAPSGAPEVHIDQDSARVVEIFYRFMQGEQSAPEESVPDEKIARTRARIYIPDVVGELHAVLQGGEWSMVEGSLHAYSSGMRGGIPHIELAREDGRVVSIAQGR